MKQQKHLLPLFWVIGVAAMIPEQGFFLTTSTNKMQKPNYYAILPASVRYDNTLKPMERILYAEITALTNQSGYCWASNNYFAELYSVSSSSISRWINALSKRKYIHLKMEYYPGTKEIKTRLISIVGVPILPIPYGQNCNEVSQSCVDPIGKNAQDNTTSINNKSIYIKENLNIPEYDETWDKFCKWADSQRFESLLKLDKISAVEFLGLRKEYSAKDIIETLLSMENYKPITKKNKTIFLTLKTWLERKNSDKKKEASAVGSVYTKKKIIHNG